MCLSQSTSYLLDVGQVAQGRICNEVELYRWRGPHVVDEQGSLICSPHSGKPCVFCHDFVNDLHPHAHSRGQLIFLVCALHCDALRHTMSMSMTYQDICASEQR